MRDTDSHFVFAVCLLLCVICILLCQHCTPMHVYLCVCLLISITENNCEMMKHCCLMLIYGVVVENERPDYKKKENVEWKRASEIKKKRNQWRCGKIINERWVEIRNKRKKATQKWNIASRLHITAAPWQRQSSHRGQTSFVLHARMIKNSSFSSLFFFRNYVFSVFIHNSQAIWYFNIPSERKRKNHTIIFFSR